MRIRLIFTRKSFALGRVLKQRQKGIRKWSTVACLSSGSFFIVQRFSLLDKNQDGHLTEDDVMSVPADVVDEAFGQTPPGEVSEFRTR